MLRSMMQMYVKGSSEALRFYQKAFNADILCEYKNDDGSYMHAELNAFGQVLAISEASDENVPGNAMQFCFHFGEPDLYRVKHAYEVLKEGAQILHPLGECSYSKNMFAIIDKFGVSWCLFT